MLRSFPIWGRRWRGRERIYIILAYWPRGSAIRERGTQTLKGIYQGCYCHLFMAVSPPPPQEPQGWGFVWLTAEPQRLQSRAWHRAGTQACAVSWMNKWISELRDSCVRIHAKLSVISTFFFSFFLWLSHSGDQCKEVQWKEPSVHCSAIIWQRECRWRGS